MSKPVVVVTVEDGVADFESVGDVDIYQFDLDNLDNLDDDELVEQRGEAAGIPPALGARILASIDEEISGRRRAGRWALSDESDA